MFLARLVVAGLGGRNNSGGTLGTADTNESILARLTVLIMTVLVCSVISN